MELLIIGVEIVGHWIHQGNNIYSRSFNIDTSLHTFKFSADNWLIQERS